MRPFYNGYLLGLLFLILALNTSEGYALGLALPSLKADLNLSDTQLGLLTGPAFAFFYAVMGVPIARWADRGNRVAIIAAATAIWSVAVALSSKVTGFGQLLLIRVVVAVGEAGCVPPAHSLIADTFPRAQRPKAAAIYMLGMPASTLIGCFVAGWVLEHFGWRFMFLTLGLPGLLPALIARLTLSEPRRATARVGVPTAAAGAALTAIWHQLWSLKTFQRLLIYFSIITFFNAGIAQWQASFLTRTYNIPPATLGVWLTIIYGAGGLLGTYGGGLLASRFAGGQEDKQLRGMMLLVLVYGVLSAFSYTAPDRNTALSCLFAGQLVSGATVGPLFAILQTLVPATMRATAVAIILLCSHLIGMGLGPILTGIISDALHTALGSDSLRVALLTLCPGFLVAALLLRLASHTVVRDIERTARDLPAQPLSIDATGTPL